MSFDRFHAEAGCGLHQAYELRDSSRLRCLCFGFLKYYVTNVLSESVHSVRLHGLRWQPEQLRLDDGLHGYLWQRWLPSMIIELTSLR